MPGSRSSMQLGLFPIHSEEFIRDYFRKATGRPVSLTITDNSTSILSARKRGGTLFVRFHKMLLHAGIDVIGEIADFLKAKKVKTPLLREFIRLNSNCLRSKPPRKAARAATPGRYHDLGALYDSINAEYFEGRISAEITWGAKGQGRAVRKRTLGSYSPHTNTIRISPVLDKKTVPRYFVEYIVYHEMLHADVGISKVNGRNIIHSREFKRREALFRDFARARAWEIGNMCG